MVTIHGTEITTEVRIIDKSKRAYDISIDAHRALEVVLQKDKSKTRFKHLCVRFQSVFYSAYIMMFKFHGSPPTARLNALFMLYSLVLSFELVLSAIFVIHIMNPMSYIWSIGFPYLFILPGLTLIAPFLGIIASLAGSPRMMMVYSSVNATIALVNYPLTLIALIFFKDQAAYIGILFMLFMNKILLSFYGGKVRQHFINPGYGKTEEKMQKYLEKMLQSDASGRFKGFTPAERASALV